MIRMRPSSKLRSAEHAGLAPRAAERALTVHERRVRLLGLALALVAVLSLVDGVLAVVGWAQ